MGYLEILRARKQLAMHAYATTPLFCRNKIGVERASDLANATVCMLSSASSSTAVKQSFKVLICIPIVSILHPRDEKVYKKYGIIIALSILEIMTVE